MGSEMAEEFENVLQRRIMSARVAAWIGVLTDMILATRVHDPVVSWQYLPDGLVRFRVDVRVYNVPFTFDNVFKISAIEAFVDLEGYARQQAKAVIEEILRKQRELKEKL